MTMRHWVVAAAAVLMLGSCKKVDSMADMPGFAAIDGEYLKSGSDGSNWA